MLDSVHRRLLALPETHVEIALLDWGGEGPLALLHHANGFCGALWNEVARALLPHYRVLALDARGHGDSTFLEGDDAYAWPVLASDLVAVAQQLTHESGQERIALGIGHSFGGTLTLAAAASRPALFDRVLMVDPVIIPKPGDPLADLRPPQPGLAERARRRRHVWADRAAARRYCESKEFFADWTPRALDLYVHEGMRERLDGQVELKCPGSVEAAIFSGGHTLDIFGRAAEVTTPVRMLHATRGNFPVAFYESLVSVMPGEADIEEVEAGHLVPMERPDLVVDAALRFAGLAD